MKYLVAIVEDSPAEVKTLRSYFARLGEELGYDFQVSCFSSGRDFLAAYQPIYDLVLMDINLPDINGMYVSKCLRKLDQNVVLMFVTSMARYAADGYEVDALDFMVKPVNYTTFSLKIKRAYKNPPPARTGSYSSIFPKVYTGPPLRESNMWRLPTIPWPIIQPMGC